MKSTLASPSLFPKSSNSKNCHMNHLHLHHNKDRMNFWLQDEALLDHDAELVEDHPCHLIENLMNVLCQPLKTKTSQNEAAVLLVHDAGGVGDYPCQHIKNQMNSQRWPLLVHGGGDDEHPFHLKPISLLCVPKRRHRIPRPRPFTKDGHLPFAKTFHLERMNHCGNPANSQHPAVPRQPKPLIPFRHPSLPSWTPRLLIPAKEQFHL